jgi:hypothetical protein
MPVRPGSVSIVGLPMGFKMPDPKTQPQRGAHGAVSAQPQPWAQARQTDESAATLPATALDDSRPQPPPLHRPAPHALSLPGFGFKYFAQETPPADQQPHGDSIATSALELVYRARAIHADSEARGAWREQTQTLAGEAAADAWFPASTVTGRGDSRCRDSPRVDSALAPATCHTLMVASSSSRRRVDGKESRLGSPCVQSLFPGHDAIPNELAADLTDDYWVAPRLNTASLSFSTAAMTTPGSSGSALFSSALAALRQRDILSAHEVKCPVSRSLMMMMKSFICSCRNNQFTVAHGCALSSLVLRHSAISESSRARALSPLPPTFLFPPPSLRFRTR